MNEIPEQCQILKFKKEKLFTAIVVFIIKFNKS